MTDSYDNPSTRPPGSVPTNDDLDAPLTDPMPPSYPAGSGDFESGATYATTGYSGQHVADTSQGGSGKVDEAKARAGEVKEQVSGEAHNVKQTATEAGGRVAGTARQEAAHVADEARRQAKDVLQQTRSQLTSQASSQQQSLAGAIRAVGGELSTMAGATQSPGVASNLANQASGVVDSVADWLESREPADVLAEVTSFARRSPGTFLGIAAAAGLVVGRLARGLKDDAADHSADGPEHLAGGYSAPSTAYTAPRTGGVSPVTDAEVPPPVTYGTTAYGTTGSGATGSGTTGSGTSGTTTGYGGPA